MSHPLAFAPSQGLPMPLKATYAEAAGMVFVMRCVPDVFTGERLNIGVCAVDAKGKREARVIAQPGRLECLYGASAENVVMLAHVALEAALAGAPSPSPQVIFDTPTPFYNVSLEEVVNSTFADQVTVALPHREQIDRLRISDEDATLSVINVLKTKIALDFELLANTPQVIVNTERGPHTMVIPLQPRNGVGTIRSAQYTPATLKTHFLDSVLDLECAGRYRDKRQLGLFILRPTGESRTEQIAVDNVIDNIAFRSPNNLRLEVSENAQTLAGLIAEWGALAA